MALLVYFVLFLALTGHSSAMFCVCKDGLSDQVLQKAIDYACGAGADCTPITQNGPCYNPNTVKDHCNYAVNSYFQRKGQTQGSCDFAGAAITSSTAPPTSSSTCVFPSSPGNTGTGTTTTPTTGTPGTSPSSFTPTTPTTGTTPTGTTPTGTTPTGTTPTGTTPTGTTPTGTTPGTNTGTGTGTGSGFGSGTGTGSTTGNPNVFGISPTSSTGTGGFNDSSNGVVHLSGTIMFLLSLVLTCWLA